MNNEVILNHPLDTVTETKVGYTKESLLEILESKKQEYSSADDKIISQFLKSLS